MKHLTTPTVKAIRTVAFIVFAISTLAVAGQVDNPAAPFSLYWPAASLLSGVIGLYCQSKIETRQ